MGRVKRAQDSEAPGGNKVGREVTTTPSPQGAEEGVVTRTGEESELEMQAGAVAFRWGTHGQAGKETTE